MEVVPNLDYGVSPAYELTIGSVESDRLEEELVPFPGLAATAITEQRVRCMQSFCELLDQSESILREQADLLECGLACTRAGEGSTTWVISCRANRCSFSCAPKQVAGAVAKAIEQAIGTSENLDYPIG